MQWPLQRGFLPYLIITVAGILWAFVLDDTRPLADASVMALFWSWYNIVLLLLACFVAVEASDRRSSNRFSVNRVGLLSTTHGTHSLLISDISVSGMRVRGSAPGPVGTFVRVQYENLDVEATVARVDATNFGLSFVQSAEAHAALIRHVYAGSYHAGVDKVRPTKVAGALLRRAFR